MSSSVRPLALLAVEHLEHAERALLVEKRHRHHRARHVAGPLRDVAGEAGIVGEVLEHERLPGHEHPAGDPGARRDPRADERTGALPGDRLEDELVRLLVVQEDRRRLGAEDRLRRRRRSS